jgi:hypothetical protein
MFIAPFQLLQRGVRAVLTITASVICVSNFFVSPLP